MIIFSYTGKDEMTCKDCEDYHNCSFTKGGTINKLPCMKSKLKPKRPKVTNAEWDFFQYKRQLTCMKVTIQAKIDEMIRDGLRPKGMNGLQEKHSFTDYCKYRRALNKASDFLKENEKNKHSNAFIDELINSEIILNDDGKIEVESRLEELKDIIKAL